MAIVTSRDEWKKQRVELLAAEKEFDRLRDALSEKRRTLPWVEVEEDYGFEGADGPTRLNDLFGANSQLIVYHFMFGADWEQGCPSCSFWADNFNGVEAHFAARDAGFAVVSIAPFAKLAAYKQRMGWDFNWVSSAGNSFNRDYAVSFSDEEQKSGATLYNFETSTFPASEAPGISVFVRDEEGKIYHSYSTYARGLDMLNGAYHYMDLLPKGRDEDALPYPMSWVKRHDDYAG